MVKKQLIIIFRKEIDGNNYRLIIDDPIDYLEKEDIEVLVQAVVETKIFGELIPLSAQIVETSISTMELEG